MAIRKSGLGKGLDLLIPEQIVEGQRSEPIQNIAEEAKINISRIEPNRSQPRINFDEDALLELAESIKQFGILQPIIVHKKGENYEIIAGERRWRAAKIAGLKDVPVIIKDLTDREIVEISLIENIQRENLNPIEEAKAYKRLLEEFELKQDEVAERVSKSRTAVTNSMRLLRLDDKVQKMIISEMISTGHARAILGIEDEKIQYNIACRVFDEKLSVRDVEKIVKSLKKQKPDKIVKQSISGMESVMVKALEEKIETKLSTKVKIQMKDNQKGKIEIEFYSNDELDRITDMIMNIND